MKRMPDGMSSRHRQCLSGTLRLWLSLVPSSLSPPLSHKLPLCSALWKSPGHTMSPRPCWTVNTHSVCSNTAAPCSLPISTRAKQNRTDGQPRSHSSTSVYLEPPLASFTLVDKAKLKEGSEHLLEEPYPEVPAGESDLSMTLGSVLAPVLLEPGLGTNPGEPVLQLTGISRLRLLCEHQTTHVLVLNGTPRGSVAGSVGSRSNVERSRNRNKS